MSNLFGTDGVRGVANIELSCHLAFDLGRAGAHVLSKNNKHPKILIGNDSRISADMLESALIAGICSVGGDAYMAGVITTPAIAYLTKHHKFDAGVMISASHNPMEYNGIKFFNSQGFKLDDDVQKEIEEIILQDKKIPLTSGSNIGRRFDFLSAEDEYIDFIRSTTSTDLSGLKIVLDCANGASSYCCGKIFSALGADVIVIHNTPDGTNINFECGSTYPEKLCKTVVENDADIGLAFDGDADRLICCDENGEVVNGDKILAICATYLKNKGKLNKNTLVATVMSNIGLIKAMDAQGIKTIQTNVGDRYVLEELQKNGYNLGGEQSGHIIFADYSTTGDGILSAVQLLAVMKETDETLAELALVMEEWPQILINARVSSGKQKTYMDYPQIVEEIKKLEDKYKDQGRLLIRASGTEPLIRVMIEGKDQRMLRDDAQDLASLIEEVIK